MKIVNKLTLRHLRLNRGRTLITILGIALSVAMVCCVAGFVMSVRDLMIREIKANRGDFHVVYIDIAPETAQQIAQEEIFSTHYTQQGETDGQINLFLRLTHPKQDIREVVGDIAEKYQATDWMLNHELLGLEGVFTRDTTLNAFISIATIAILIIMAGSVLVIANAFFISASERVRQFGLLKSAGATSKQLRRSILFEAAVLTAIAIPVGILLGFLIQAVVLWLVNGLLLDIANMADTEIAFHVVFEPVILYISAAVAVLTVLISAWLPARRAAGISPIDAVRQTRDIKIRARKLKTSRLTGLLFGFEGTLAAKSLKRSRGKYRATVIGLTASIVLFVSMSSFVSVLNKSANMEYGGYDFDVEIYAWGNPAVLEEIDTVVKSLPNAEISTYKHTYVETTLPDGFFTEQAMENDYGSMLYLHAIPDEAFEKIAPTDAEGMRGILINNSGVYHQDGQVIEFLPYDCVPGTKLPLQTWAFDENTQEYNTVAMGSVTVTAVIDQIPDWFVSSMVLFGSVNIFVPESEYRAFLLENKDTLNHMTNTSYLITTDDPDTFCRLADEKLAEYQTSTDSGLGIINVSEMTRLYRSIVLIVMIFGYGFIGMLSLIAVTSVIATISTGMTLRRQEFALLFSAGMTSKGMNKMLNLESLLYGMKSLLIGLPIGTALSYLIHLGIGNMVVYAYQPPWGAMAICVAAVMLLTFGTMRYGKKKLKKISIIEAIRSETI